MRRGTATPTILLAEDNPDDVELTLMSLESHRIANDVYVVRDGQEALDFLFREDRYAGREGPDPHVILLDLKMPKVDGLEVLRRIKHDHRTRRIPVVMLTSSREETDVVRSYDLGANSYIVKPVDFGQFQEAINALGLYWLVMNEPGRATNAGRS